jgi:3-oxoacyl-[acyl-carrier-protein] synthase-3
METLASPPLAEIAPTLALPAVEHPRKSTLAVSVLGTGACVPSEVVPNEYFETLGIQTSAAWIAERTGIRERRRASETETTTSLAARAAQTALARAGLSAKDIDLVVVATSTPDYTMPTTACLVQERIGAVRAAAFDISNACAGYVYALDIAARYVATGFQRALVIGADLGSRLVSYADRGTCIFFGDGAGAVVVGSGGSGRILATELGSSGDATPLSVPVGGAMTMDGRAIWNFATRVLPDTVRQLCRKAGVAVSDIKLLVPHQANKHILALAVDELGLPLSRVAINIDRYGNTLAASIPIALDEALAAGKAGPGDLVAMVGFGAGLAWGGILLEL